MTTSTANRRSDKAGDGREAPARRPSPLILLAEDDLDVQNLVRHVLQAEGYEVEVCGDGETALQRCLEAAPDLLVLDVMMPRLTGFEVLSRLRSAGAGRRRGAGPRPPAAT